MKNKSICSQLKLKRRKTEGSYFANRYMGQIIKKYIQFIMIIQLEFS